MMTDEELYAKQWNVSAEYFYEKGYYIWMAEKLADYNVVLEIGCGTGYSTLALIEKGYKVIAVDKNEECITKAKSLIIEKGYTDDNVVFILSDIAIDSERQNMMDSYDFDVVVCWNVGSFWNRQMIEHYLPYMLEYGLNRQQIAANPESSYSELIIWDTCRVAAEKGVAAHIVDRGAEVIDESTDPYYHLLKDEFNFHEIKYDTQRADSISSGGRMLVTNGIVNSENKVDIVFVSVLYK